jgi:hypothetical protein
MKRFRPEEKLLISHNGRKFHAECRKVIEETAAQALRLELKVYGVLLSGHLVQLTADGKEFVPCLVRESLPEGNASRVVVQAMADWRVTPRRPGL